MASDATLVRRRRGTESQCESMTPAEGEIIVDLTNDTTRVGDGVRQGGYIQPNFSQIQRQSFVFAVAGGTANALTASISPAPAALSQPLLVKIKASNTNTGATTLDLNGFGVRDVTKVSGGNIVPLVGGDIVSGGFYELVYDGARWVISNVQQTQRVTSGSYAVSAVRPLQYFPNVESSGTPGEIYFYLPSSPVPVFNTWFSVFGVNCPYSGIVRCSLSLFTSTSSARWYIGESPVGTTISGVTTNLQDIAISAGDNLSLRVYIPSSPVGAFAILNNITISTNEYLPAFPMTYLYRIKNG